MNNKSKKIAAACLALAMVASVGAADVAGILPVVYYADVSYYQLKNDEEGTHKIPATSTKTLNFRLDLAVKPVKLTDPTTGVSVYTTTKYVSENAALVSSDVPTDSAAYKTMAEHCENLYNDMLFK